MLSFNEREISWMLNISFLPVMTFLFPSHTTHLSIHGSNIVNLLFKWFLKQCNYEYRGILKQGKYYIKLSFLNYDENRQYSKESSWSKFKLGSLSKTVPKKGMGPTWFRD